MKALADARLVLSWYVFVWRSILRPSRWLALMLSVAALAQAPQAVARPWRVVILPGADLSQPAAAQQLQALRASLKAQAPDGIEFYVDALDGFRFNTASLIPHFVELMKTKYADKQVDLVIGLADFALEFTRRYHQEIWPDVPVLITSIESERLRQLQQPAQFAYLPLQLDVDGTLDLIAALQPRLKRLVLVTGSTAVDLAWVRRVSGSLARHARRGWQVETWSGLPQAELIRRVAALDSSVAVLYSTMYRDHDGGTYFPYEVVGPLVTASGAPIYGWYGTYVSYGLTAGAVVDFAAQGERTAQLAASILRKEQPAAGATLPSNPSQCVVDVGRMEAFDLDVAAIPPGCRRINVPSSLWREHRTSVLAALCTLALQTFTIGALLWQRRRRRLAEEEAVQRRSELARAARIASIGELSASIAHEVSQPLGAIVNNADAAGFMLGDAVLDRDEMRQILDDVRRDAMRANHIVQRQRAMLKRHEAEFVPLSLDAVFEEGMDLLRLEARRRACELHCEFGAGQLEAMGDRIQLQQVLLNLVLNAMDAVQALGPERRRITVVTCAGAGFHVLSVKDRGPGISAKVLPRIFDSFYTTKEQGTGLGLSIVRAIVATHDGQVKVSCGQEAGTVFEVRIPASGTAQRGSPDAGLTPAAAWVEGRSPGV